MPKLFRVVVPTADIERSTAFYATLLEAPGERISPGRHYFDCGGVILACVDPKVEATGRDARPNSEHIYLAVDDLDAAFARTQAAGCSWLEAKIETRPWGERSFYLKDPFGNPVCFVDAATCFTGFHLPRVGEMA